MKSIQNTTDHDISIASLKSAVDRLEERIENMTVIQTQGKVFIIRGGKTIGETMRYGVNGTRAVVHYIGRHKPRARNGVHIFRFFIENACMV